jgi:hypothetical protein
MIVFIDCQAGTFSTIQPNIENRMVIEQVLPAMLPVAVVVGILSAIRDQASLNVDIVYKITIN